MALDITGIVTHIQIDREHVTPEDEDNARRFNEAMRELADACFGFVTTVDEWAAVALQPRNHTHDEAHGMTLEELIPETINEWKRIREEEEQ